MADTTTQKKKTADDRLARLRELRERAGKAGQDVAPRTAYRVGTLPTSPWHNLTFATVTFPRATNPLVAGERPGMKAPGPPVPGAVVKLTDDEVAKVEEAIVTTVVRGVGTTNPARLRTIDRRYTAALGDRPIAEFVYFRRADEPGPEDGAVRSWLADLEAKLAADEERAEREDEAKDRKRKGR